MSKHINQIVDADTRLTRYARRALFQMDAARQKLPIHFPLQNPDALLRERILTTMMNQSTLSKVFLSVLMLIAMSACRFGNHADAPTQIGGNSITHSELFFTEVKKFETFAYYNDNTHTSNSSSPLVSVPSDLLEVFTNPVYWDTIDDANQTQFFWDKEQAGYPWVTLADASGHIDAVTTNPSSGGARFYRNPNCLTQIQTEQFGDFDRTTPGTTLLPGQTQHTNVSGHLKMDITSVQVFQGDCADDLTELANCFQNGTGCDADQLSRAKMFNLFVNGTGVLNIHDAAKIIGLAYIVHFE